MGTSIDPTPNPIVPPEPATLDPTGLGAGGSITPSPAPVQPATLDPAAVGGGALGGADGLVNSAPPAQIADSNGQVEENGSVVAGPLVVGE